MFFAFQFFNIDDYFQFTFNAKSGVNSIYRYTHVSYSPFNFGYIWVYEKVLETCCQILRLKNKNYWTWSIIPHQYILRFSMCVLMLILGWVRVSKGYED